MYFLLIINILCDAPVSWQLSFQDAASPIMEGIVNLHNNIMMIITSIFLFVFFILVRAIQLFKFPSPFPISNVTAAHQLETWWTIIPTIILCVIAGPSFAVLYGMDALILPQLTVKVIGRQWYWTYEDTCWSKRPLIFDSYMKNTESILSEGGFRLLSVDRSLVLPVRTAIRLLITSSDVLHSWAIPSLGVKMDACPGRLNQVTLFIKRPGFFYGQCSELCGINHAFMPICIEAVDILDEEAQEEAKRIAAEEAKRIADAEAFRIAEAKRIEMEKYEAELARQEKWADEQERLRIHKMMLPRRHLPNAIYLGRKDRD